MKMYDKFISRTVLLVTWWAAMITTGVVYDLWACALLLVASCAMGLWWVFEEDDDSDAQ